MAFGSTAMLQSTALDILKMGHNVFITGSAGAGKSYTIKQYLEYLKTKKIPDSAIAITASTGIAATQIGGCTIHSWSGIGIKTEMSDEDILTMIRYRGDKIDIIRDAKVLFLDETSMLHRKQLNLVDRVLQVIRRSSEPFGGIQVVLSGDFFQLPPVVKNSTLETDRDRFCFMGDSWVNAKFKVCYLTEQYRNSKGELNEILNAIRDGNVSDKHMEMLNSRRIPIDPTSNMLQLYTHNTNVDLINMNKLISIPSEAVRFQAEKIGKEAVLKSLVSSILAPMNLELKIGAKVMFVKNNTEGGYANGTQGTVTKFVKDEEHAYPSLPVVELHDGTLITAEPAEWTFEENGKVIASVKQIPLRLAWAITIHKSQGMTLDEAVVDLGNTFETAQGYVALSRLRDITGLYLKSIRESALALNPLAIKADSRFKELSEIVESDMSRMSQNDIAKAHKAHLKFLK